MTNIAITPKNAMNKNAMNKNAMNKNAMNKKVNSIPNFIIESFNEIIVKNMDPEGRSKVNQDDVVSLIVANNPNIERISIFTNSYLDVEELFRNKGWGVVFHRTPYYDSSSNYFIFSSK